MNLKPAIATALMLGAIALPSTLNTNKVVAAPTQLPYCTAASNKGAAWWTWSQSSIEKSCFTAFSKVLGMGHSVDRATWGYYNPNGLNKATVSCKQGSEQVIGTGSLVFENGVNMGKKKDWSGCTMKIN